MTTLVPVTFSNSIPPFSGVLTLDGKAIIVTATWNLPGQRWYFQLADLSGTVLWFGPLIGSPANADTYLAPGVFQTSTLLYRSGTGNFETVP